MLEDHLNFTKTEHFAKLHELITPTRADRVWACHVEMDLAQLEESCRQPVTEVVAAYFSRDVDKDAVAQAWSQTMSQSDSITTKGAAHGWTLEDLEHPDLAGVRRRAYFGNIGREISTSSTDSKLGASFESNLRSVTGDDGVKVVTASNPHYDLFVYAADGDAETHVLCAGGQWHLTLRKRNMGRTPICIHRRRLAANQAVQCWQVDLFGWLEFRGRHDEGPPRFGSEIWGWRVIRPSVVQET